MNSIMQKKQDMNFLINHLEEYGSCACGRRIIQMYSVDKILDELKSMGYSCRFELVRGSDDVSKYPRDGTYIIWLEKKTKNKLIPSKINNATGLAKSHIRNASKWKILDHGFILLNHISIEYVEAERKEEILSRKVYSTFKDDEGCLLVEVM